MKKKKFYVILFLLIALAVSATLFVNSRKDSNLASDNTNEVPEEIKVTENYHFVAVDDFKDYKDNLDLEEYTELRKITLKKYEQFTGEDLTKSYVESKDELYSELQECDDCIGLLGVEDLELRFKNITVVEYNIFDKGVDLEENPLLSTREVELTREEIEDSYSDWYKTNETDLNITVTNINKEDYTRFFAGGEIITGRGVDIKWLSYSNDNLEFLFDRIKPDIEQADLAIALLEHSFKGDPVPCPLCTSFTGGESLIKDIKNVGLDVLSLAGNHIGDGGLDAEVRTIELLDEQSLTYFGAGENLEEASKPAIVEIKGEKYAFLGADDIATFFWAGENSRGSNRYSSSASFGDGVIDVEKVEKDMQAAKSAADKVIVYMSWGTEYTNKNTEHQQELAHLMIDNGADIIISSHVHWIQNMEIYKGKLIMYGLGNFIFDQTHSDPTREAIHVNMNFKDSELINLEVVPMLTCGYHFGAKNLANEVISGRMTYEQVDAKNEDQECVWLQPKPLDSTHPKYKEILDRLYEYTDI